MLKAVAPVRRFGTCRRTLEPDDVELNRRTGPTHLSPLASGLSRMTELRRSLIGRGLVQSLSRSSLRTQGPITPGVKGEKRPLLECRSESPRRRDERFALTLGSLRSQGRPVGKFHM